MALVNINSCEQREKNFQNETQILRNVIGKCQQRLKKCQKEAANECSSDQSEYGSLQPIGNVVISLIRNVENAREIDACIGMSTELGYVTSKQCCEADQLMLFDLEAYEEIPIGLNSIWNEEHVCFINTTEIEEMNFATFNNKEPQSCSTLAFDESEGQFIEHQLEIKLKKCFDSPCSFKIDPKLFQNRTILNGTSVVCDEANQIGIVTKSKF